MSQSTVHSTESIGETGPGQIFSGLFSILLFEVALTRVFSFYLQYHYSFLALSYAVGGMGLGGGAAYLCRRKWPGLLSNRWLFCSLLFSLAMTETMVFFVMPLSTGLKLSSAAAMAAAVSVIPFVIGGAYVAFVLEAGKSRLPIFYAAQLGGAAAGALCAPLLMNIAGPMAALFGSAGSAVIAGLGAAPISLKLRRMMGIGVLLFSVLLLCLAAHGLLPLGFGISEAPENSPLSRKLEKGWRITQTRWEASGRIDLLVSDDHQLWREVYVDGSTPAIMLSKKREGITLTKELAYLPFLIGPVKRVLSLGAGAGYDIRLSLQAGAKTVDAIEISPAMVETTRLHASYHGGLYENARVQTHIEEARAFLAGSAKLYDVIMLALLQGQSAGGKRFGLAEGYAHTLEAVQLYLSKLNPGGRLAVLFHHRAYLRRFLYTAYTVLRARGMNPGEAARHLMGVESPATAPYACLAMVLQKPLPSENLQTLADRIGEQGFTPYYLPLLHEKGGLGKLARGEITFPRLLESFKGNYAPVRDGRPFFFHIDRELPASLVILLVAALGGALLFVLILSIRLDRGSSCKPIPPLICRVLFFGALGFGFMSLEVAFIHRLTPVLGLPGFGFALSLAAFLFGAGVGSLLLQKFVSSSVVWIAPITVAVLSFAAVWVVPPLGTAISVQAPVIRIIAITGIFILLGLPMGMPFPAGLSLLGEWRPGEIPWAVGFNGMMTLLGGSAAFCIWLMSGFRLAVLTGCLCYLTAGLVALGFRVKHS